MGTKKSRDPTMQALLDEPSGRLPETPSDLPQDIPAHEKLYSAGQIGIGTFIFGPLAAMLYLKKNLGTLGRGGLVTLVTGFCLLYAAGLVVLLYMIQQKFLWMAICALNFLVVTPLAQHWGMGGADIKMAGYDQQSWGKTFIVGLVGFVLFIALLTGTSLSLSQMLPHH